MNKINIFVLDKDPKLAASYQCNKHVVKMIIESAQLLCTAHNVAPYKKTHYNHPCAIWTRQSLQNYCWLVEHALELCNQYTVRYGKIHKTQAVIEWCEKNKPNLPNIGLTSFVLAIKNTQYHDPDPVKAYRNYYVAEKSKFAKWKPKCNTPSWWPFREAD